MRRAAHRGAWAGVVAVAVMLSWLGLRAAAGPRFDRAYPTSLSGPVPVGVPYSGVVQFRARSSWLTAHARAVEAPPLAAGVHMAYVGVDNDYGVIRNALLTPGDVRRLAPSHVVPLSRLEIGPQQDARVVVVLAFDRPGTYVVGPIRLHWEALGGILRGSTGSGLTYRLTVMD